MLLKAELKILKKYSIKLLSELIATPSLSRNENLTADVIEKYLKTFGVEPKRIKNNVIAKNKYFDSSKETILLCSHHDTVPPNKNYKLNPFKPIKKNGKIFGLGSNDAGGSIVSLFATFLFFYNVKNLKYNLMFVASAEEEISGKNGFELVNKTLPKIYCALVGEPTEMDLAIAERGLIVLDCVAHGKPGHTAREEGINSIYIAAKDIDWIKNYKFKKDSKFLGPIKMSVTSIETQNKAHNITPESCKFIVDVRVNELYSFKDILSVIKKNIKSEIKPRSLRLTSSKISENHKIVLAGVKLGRKIYGSPTTSDKALMKYPALKIGPGSSSRSHVADEYILEKEIFNGINIYIKMLSEIL